MSGVASPAPAPMPDAAAGPRVRSVGVGGWEDDTATSVGHAVPPPVLSTFSVSVAGNVFVASRRAAPPRRPAPPGPATPAPLYADHSWR